MLVCSADGYVYGAGDDAGAYDDSVTGALCCVVYCSDE